MTKKITDRPHKNSCRVKVTCVVCGKEKIVICSKYFPEKHVCSVECRGLKTYRARHIFWQEGKKKCKVCGEHKLLEDYTKDVASGRIDGKGSTCKSCFIPKVLTEKQKLWHKDYCLKKNYGINLEDFNTISKSQGDRCYLCDEPAGTTTSKRLVVDHCHATGSIRKLLCGTCNTALGSFRDSPELIRKAALYIEEHQQEEN